MRIVKPRGSTSFRACIETSCQLRDTVPAPTKSDAPA